MAFKITIWFSDKLFTHIQKSKGRLKITMNIPPKMNSGGVNPSAFIRSRILQMPELICSTNRILSNNPKIRGFRLELFLPNSFFAIEITKASGLILILEVNNHRLFIRIKHFKIMFFINIFIFQPENAFQGLIIISKMEIIF